MSKRKEILETALNLTTGDRNKSYGDPLDNLTTLANLISAYLKIDITAVDAAIIMNLTKVSRVAVNKNHEDNYVDGAAYMAIAGECAARLEDVFKEDFPELAGEESWILKKVEATEQHVTEHPPWGMSYIMYVYLTGKADGLKYFTDDAQKKIHAHFSKTTEPLKLDSLVVPVNPIDVHREALKNVPLDMYNYDSSTWSGL